VGELVQFQANGRTCDGYLAIPKEGSGPGVIVIQEWWGLVDHIKHVCERLPVKVSSRSLRISITAKRRGRLMRQASC
jgi:hypothetical protein